MIRPVLVALALLSLGLVTHSVAPQGASAQARVVEATVENAFPGSLVFHLTAEADTAINDIAFTFSYGGRASSGLRTPEAFAPAASVTTSVTVQVASGGTSIPVGTDVTYSWEIRTADGQVLVTPPETFLYMPPNREWQSLESDAVRIYYHGDREGSARELLNAAQETYDRMAVGLLKTELEFVPVRVILFVNEAEMDAARKGRSNTLDDLTQTCGLKVSSEVVYVIQTCDSIATADVLRHEFAHIINEAAGEGPLSVMPSWLDEGTAVYAQSEVGSGFESAIESAKRSGRFIPFADMPLPANDPRLTNLFYGQSWAMVNFLIEREGPEEFARMFALMKDGTRYDRAIEQVYGFDLAGFEDAFLASMNAQRAVTPTPTSSGARPTSAPVPTRAPLSTSATKDDDGGGLDTATIAIIGVAALFGLLAVFAFLLSSMLSANRRAAAASAAARSVPAQGPGDTWTRPEPPAPQSSESLLRTPPPEPGSQDQPRE